VTRSSLFRVQAIHECSGSELRNQTRGITDANLRLKVLQVAFVTRACRFSGS